MMDDTSVQSMHVKNGSSHFARKDSITVIGLAEKTRGLCKYPQHEIVFILVTPEMNGR